MCFRIGFCFLHLSITHLFLLLFVTFFFFTSHNHFFPHFSRAYTYHRTRSVAWSFFGVVIILFFTFINHWLIPPFPRHFFPLISYNKHSFYLFMFTFHTLYLLPYGIAGLEFTIRFPSRYHTPHGDFEPSRRGSLLRRLDALTHRPFSCNTTSLTLFSGYSPLHYRKHHHINGCAHYHHDYAIYL